MTVIIVIIAVLLPRVAVAYLWFTTNWFTGVFDTYLWPLVGFVFAPASVLWYTVVEQNYQGSWGVLQIGVMVLAVYFDFAASRKSSNRED